MSGSLVPVNSSTAFAQQGSLDWVALGNSSVNLSVAVLSRLSKAGIDAFTLQVGRAICCNFVLEPDGQQHIADAISKLRRYGSYKDLIWFGFGIKDIVTDLADTEEGLTLVALCSALTTTYDSWFAAKVLRKLCLLCKAPQSFTPSLRQWKALVEVCTGILASSQFITLANGFRRLISGSSAHTSETRCCPTTHTALANAIFTLANLSKHYLVNATFIGALDCAWLAAFAEWLLSLDVGISDSQGIFLYRSRKGLEIPQVTIMLVNANGDLTQNELLSSKASIVPNGQSLFHKDPAFGALSLLNWQASWTTILHDAFHARLDTLTEGEIGSGFATLLKCVSILPRSYAEANDRNRELVDLDPCWRNHPVNPLLRLSPDRNHFRYIDFVKSRLPELSCCPCLDQPLPPGNFVSTGQDASEAISAACTCAVHGNADNMQTEEDRDQVCLQIMAETIIVFIWILLDSDIDSDVLPSITGLLNLYTWQSSVNKFPRPAKARWYQSVMSCDYPVLGIDLVLHVLSGMPVSGAPPKYEALPVNYNLARAGNGLCVYHNAVADPTGSLETMFRLRVVRGYIAYSGSQYKYLAGLSGDHTKSGLEISDFHGEPTVRSIETFVQEIDDDGRLEMAYLVHYHRKNSGNGIYSLHLPILFRKLQRMEFVPCRGRCLPLYESVPFKYPTQRGYTREVDKVSVERAQTFLNSTENMTSAWAIMRFHLDKVTYTIINNQPLLLYIMTGEVTINISPHVQCVHCICVMCTGFDVCSYVKSVEFENTDSSSVLVTWETREHPLQDNP